MPNSQWKQEYIAILVFALLATITGMISGYWTLSFLIWLLVYVIWKIIEFKSFFNWYMNGASKSQTPVNHGVFEAITCKVIKNKNQTKAAQKHSKQLLKQFVTTAQALPFATLMLNQRYEIQWVNQAAQEILNISNLDKNSKIDNFIRDPEFIKMINNHENDQIVKINFGKDRKSIQIRLIEISKDSFLVVARDISAQEALQKSRKAFVANASHELRTPLTVISGYLEMLMSSEQLQDEWVDAIKQAINQTNRMSNIIDGLLELSKIEHDKALESQDEELSMPVILNGFYNDIKNSTDAVQHYFYAEIDSSLHLKANHSEISSVCLNLMHNAIIHTPKGTNITIKWFLQDDEAYFLVQDNGPGIDEKHIPHLTERFYRVDNSRTQNHQSTGLGLAIVKHICLKHQARFEIKSEKGKGTQFAVIFPQFRVVKKH